MHVAIKHKSVMARGLSFRVINVVGKRWIYESSSHRWQSISKSHYKDFNISVFYRLHNSWNGSSAFKRCVCTSIEASNLGSHILIEFTSSSSSNYINFSYNVKFN